MIWKRGRRAKAKEAMATLEEMTAEVISVYKSGNWDMTLSLADAVGELVKPISYIPRMEICLYHVDSIRLRIAYKRKDVELIREVAKKGGPEVAKKAFNTLTRIASHDGDPDPNAMSLDSILRESEQELGFLSDAESQISHMRNPHPDLIGTYWFCSLYRDDRSSP
jgi:hypothetical protein